MSNEQVTIERKTLKRLLRWIGVSREIIEPDPDLFNELRAALAAQTGVDDHLKCGHHQFLAINSAETGEFLYCDLCDAKSGRADAEQQERDLQERVRVLREALEKIKNGNCPYPYAMTDEGLVQYHQDLARAALKVA